MIWSTLYKNVPRRSGSSCASGKMQPDQDHSNIVEEMHLTVPKCFGTYVGLTLVNNFALFGLGLAQWNGCQAKVASFLHGQPKFLIREDGAGNNLRTMIPTTDILRFCCWCGPHPRIFPFEKSLVNEGLSSAIVVFQEFLKVLPHPHTLAL